MAAKIIIATLLSKGGQTGVQTHFNAFKNFLSERGHKVCLITPFSYSKLLVFPVFGLRRLIDRFSGPMSVWWYRYWHYFFLKLALKKNLRNDNPLIIYAQCPLSAKAAIEARSTANHKIIMVVHFNISQADEWAEKGKIKIGGLLYSQIKQIEQSVLPKLDGIVYVSQFMKRALLAACPEIAHVHSAVIPNFCEQIQTSGSLNITSDIVSVGTLEPRKNQAYLLQVVAEAKKLGNHYSLTLIGDGPDRGKLELLANTLEITNQVNFMGFQKNAAQFLAGHRVYAHSAMIENLPIVLIEAMASALPLLAGSSGGIPEIFSDGVEGFFWPLDNPAEGARKLICLVEDDDLYRKMSQAAVSRFAGTFSTYEVANRLLAFLVEVSLDNSKNTIASAR